jgi:hypothetical protein
MNSTDIDINLIRELAEIKDESTGWIQRDDGAYRHVGREDGVVDAGMAAPNVLLVL